MLNFPWTKNETKQQLLEIAQKNSGNIQAAATTDATAADQAQIRKADVLSVFFKGVLHLFEQINISAQSNEEKQEKKTTLRNNIGALWQSYKINLPKNLQDIADTLNQFVVVPLPQSCTQTDILYASFRAQLFPFFLNYQEKKLWDAREFECSVVTTKAIYSAPHSLDGTRDFHTNFEKRPKSQEWQKLLTSSPFKVDENGRHQANEENLRINVAVFLSKLTTLFQEEFLAWIKSDPSLMTYITALNIPYDTLVLSALNMYSHILCPTDNIDAQHSIQRSLRTVIDPVATRFCDFSLKTNKSLEDTLKDCCDIAQEKLSTTITGHLTDAEYIYKNNKSDTALGMLGQRTDPEAEWENLTKLTPPEQYVISEKSFANLRGKSTDEVLSHFNTEKERFSSDIPEEAAELKNAAKRRLHRMFWNELILRAAKSNDNDLLQVAVKERINKPEVTEVTENNNESYEDSLTNSLASGTQPVYFTEARIQQYFLNQIQAFQEHSNVKSAPAMIEILNSHLSLLEKLQLLAKIGEGKSNNSLASPARMNRQPEVKKFFKDVSACFSGLQSSDQISGRFHVFLHQHEKAEAKIPNIEQHIARYTLLHENLKLIDKKSLSPSAQERLAVFDQRDTYSRQHPEQIFIKIQDMQEFLHTYRKELHRAIAASTPEQDYDDDTASVTADDGENPFTTQFSHWIQFSISAPNWVDYSRHVLSDLSFIGALPEPEAIIDCCELIRSRKRDLGDREHFFIEGLANVVLTANHAAQEDLIIALAARIAEGSEEAQEVLNQVFYKATQSNNKQLLETLASALPHAQKEWQTYEPDLFDGEAGIQQYLIDQIKGLRRIIPGTGKFTSGISVPTTLGYDAKVTSATAMEKILTSTLSLAGKLQLLAKVGAAKREDEYKRKVRLRLPETQTFYELLQNFSGVTEENTFEAFVNFLFSAGGIQAPITTADIEKGFETLWQHLSCFPEDNDFNDKQSDKFNKFFQLVIAKAGNDIDLLKKIAEISTKILLRTSSKRIQKNAVEENIRLSLLEKIDSLLSRTDIDASTISKTISETTLEETQFPKLEPFFSVEKVSTDIVAEDVLLAKTKNLNKKVTFAQRDAIVSEVITNSDAPNNLQAEMKRALQEQQDSTDFFEPEKSTLQSIYNNYDKLTYTERFLLHFSQQKIPPRMFTLESIISYIKKRMADAKINDADITSIFDSALPFCLKLRFASIIANKKTKTDAFYTDLSAFASTNADSNAYNAFSTLVQKNYNFKSNVETYIQRHILLLENIKLIASHFNLQTKDDFDDLQAEIKFDNPKTVLDEIELFKNFIIENKTDIKNAIAKNKPTESTTAASAATDSAETTSPSFVTSFMQWVQFSLKTGEPLHQEDLFLIPVVPTLADIIECRRQITKLFPVAEDQDAKQNNKKREEFTRQLDLLHIKTINQATTFDEQLDKMIEFVKATGSQQPPEATPEYYLPSTIIIEEMVNNLEKALKKANAQTLSESEKRVVLENLINFFCKGEKNSLYKELLIIAKNLIDQQNSFANQIFNHINWGKVVVDSTKENNGLTSSIKLILESALGNDVYKGISNESVETTTNDTQADVIIKIFSKLPPHAQKIFQDRWLSAADTFIEQTGLGQDVLPRWLIGMYMAFELSENQDHYQNLQDDNAASTISTYRLQLLPEKAIVSALTKPNCDIQTLAQDYVNIHSDPRVLGQVLSKLKGLNNIEEITKTFINAYCEQYSFAMQLQLFTQLDKVNIQFTKPQITQKLTNYLIR